MFTITEGGLTIRKRIDFVQRLFERLWEIYRKHVPYARIYEDMVREAGGSFVNDHVAFRTLHIEGENLGIPSISRIFMALGFEPQQKDPLQFPDQHLIAYSYRHPNTDLPKVFISQLQASELSRPIQKIISEFAEGWHDLLGTDAIQALRRLEGLSEVKQDELLEKLVTFFTKSPWRHLPKEDELQMVNEQSQYGAWVMLFGNQVNHFTAYVNAIGIEKLNDIEKVAASMTAREVPMKDETEGERGSKLRQTSTKATLKPVTVLDGDGVKKQIKWAYAYFEIAERNVDPETGKLFQGFLVQQAKKLFGMTKMKQ